MTNKQLLDNLSTKGRIYLDDDAVYAQYLEKSKDPAFKKMADELSTKGRVILDDDSMYAEYNKLIGTNPADIKVSPNVPVTETQFLNDDGTPYSDAQYAATYNYLQAFEALKKKGYSDEKAQLYLAMDPQGAAAKIAGSDENTQLAMDALGSASMPGRAIAAAYMTPFGSGYTDKFMANMANIKGDPSKPIESGIMGMVKSPATPLMLATGGVGKRIVGSGVEGTGALGMLSKMVPSLQLPTRMTNIATEGLAGAVQGTYGTAGEAAAIAATNLPNSDLTKQENLTGMDFALGTGLGGGLSALGQFGSSLKPVGKLEIPTTSNLGDIGEAVNTTLGKVYPNAVPGEYSNLGNRIQSSAELAQSGLSKEANAAVKDFSRIVQTKDDAKILADLTLRAEKGFNNPITIADEEGAKLLNEAIDITSKKLSTYGNDIGSIDKKYLNDKPAISTYEMLDEWNRNLEKNLGVKADFSNPDDIAIIPIKDKNKIDENSESMKYVLNQSKALYNELYKVTDTGIEDFLRKPIVIREATGMTSEGIRNKEKLIRQSIPGVEKRTDDSWGYVENMLNDFHKYSKDQVLKALEKAGASKSELDTYNKARQGYYDYSHTKKLIDDAAGAEMHTPTDLQSALPTDPIYQRGGTFLQRLAGQTGTQGARQIATMIKASGGTDPVKHARLVKLAMEASGDVMRSGARVRTGYNDGITAGMMNAMKEKLSAQSVEPAAIKSATAERMMSPMKDINLNLNPQLPGLGNMAPLGQISAGFNYNMTQADMERARQMQKNDSTKTAKEKPLGKLPGTK